MQRSSCGTVIGSTSMIEQPVFVYRFLPESKDLPVEDIIRLFEPQKETAMPATYPPDSEGMNYGTDRDQPRNHRP
jgi:hypothetical protein